MTGCGKRDHFAHTTIVQHRCCCSKTPKFLANRYLQLLGYTNFKIKKLDALLTGQVKQDLAGQKIRLKNQ